MPSVSLAEGSKDKSSDEPMVNATETENHSGFSLSKQQIPDLVTLSLLPKSQWQSLINLDIIKVYPYSFITYQFSSYLSSGFNLSTTKC